MAGPRLADSWWVASLCTLTCAHGPSLCTCTGTHADLRRQAQCCVDAGRAGAAPPPRLLLLQQPALPLALPLGMKGI